MPGRRWSWRWVGPEGEWQEEGWAELDGVQEPGGVQEVEVEVDTGRRWT